MATEVTKENGYKSVPMPADLRDELRRKAQQAVRQQARQRRPHRHRTRLMKFNLTKYRGAIDTFLESIEPLAFHVKARSLAPRLTTKLFHLKQETLIREKQERLYRIIEAHERDGFRITTPYRTRVRFNEIYPLKTFNTEER